MKKKDFNYNSTKDIVVRVFGEFVWPNKWKFIIAILLMLLAAMFTAYRAYLIKPAIDDVFVKKDELSLIFIPIQIIFVAVCSCFVVYLQGLLMSITNNKINISLQEKLFSVLIRKDMNFFQKQSAGKISGYFGDIVGISEIINIILTNLILQFFTIVFLFILMLKQNIQLSILSFVAFPLVVLPVIKIGKKMRKLSDDNREKALDNASLMVESFDNIKIVKSNNREKHEINRVRSVLNSIYRLNLMISKKSLVVSPMIEMMGTVGFALVIWYGGMSVIKGTSTAGEFFVFIAALMSVYKPFKSFTGINIKMQNAIACARRYFIVIDQENFVKEKENPINLINIKGNIKFKDVFFSYPLNDFNSNVVNEKEEVILSNKLALKNINLNITNGKSYALVGHSGSGKSTIFNLILRFYDVTGGKITIDDVDIRELSFKNLRDSISIVEQDVKLFNTSIFDNIKYAKTTATKEEIINVAKMANVDEFVSNLENGYDTIVGPNGALLSGGQKQRISIARAFLKNAPILLLDEATSALDPISESLIQESLKELMKDRTTIIIAHRLTTIMNCDHIFVLEDGELKEQGTHNELIAKNGVYKNLCDKQFNRKND